MPRTWPARLQLLLAAAVLALAAAAPARAQSDADSIARVGAAGDYVTDQARVFTGEGRVAIERYCGKVERALGVQFAVVTVASLGAETIEQFTERQFREWGVGGRKSDQGLLLAIAVREHRIRFEVGYGLEGPLPDMRAGRIIRETLTPAFRAGRYDDGVLDALTQAAAFVAQDKNLPAPVPDNRPVPGGARDHGLPVGILLPILFVFIVLNVLGRMLGGGRRGRFYGGFGGFGGGGFGGGGFGGGFGGGSGSGFGGFGGGGSGGGGASGGW